MVKWLKWLNDSYVMKVLLLLLFILQQLYTNRTIQTDTLKERS